MWNDPQYAEMQLNKHLKEFGIGSYCYKYLYRHNDKKFIIQNVQIVSSVTNWQRVVVCISGAYNVHLIFVAAVHVHLNLEMYDILTFVLSKTNINI